MSGWKRFRGSRARTSTTISTVAIAAWLLLATAAPASAHAELVDTDPDEGAVLVQAPAVVTFSFNEPVRGVPDGVEVFDAEGERVASSSRTRDKQLLVTLDDEVGDGSLVVAWRVVSVDGHPISGTLTFAVGAPSPTVNAPVADDQDDVPLALSLARWPAYAGLLLAVGLVWFATLLLPLRLDRLDRVWQRLRRTARRSAAVAAVAWVVGIPLTALYLRGSGTLLQSATWGALPSEEVVLPGVTVLALAVAVSLLPAKPGRTPRHLLAALAGLLALAPLPLAGHTRAGDEAALLIAADGLHLVAGAVWLGGLVGLALTLPALSGRHELAAALLSRFSGAAASALAALVAAGAFLAWRIVGSWEGLVDNGYGQLLLVKIGVAAIAAAIAAYNRFRLLPRVREAAGFHDRVATSRSLTRTASAEAVALVAVLLVTGFLVQKSPPRESIAVPAGATQIGRAELGDFDAEVALSPGVPGMNTVTVRVVDEAGDLAEWAELRNVRITSGVLGGDVPLVPIEPGAFEGRVVIPREGLWRVQVSLRLSEFDNPVASVDFEVGEQ